MFDVGFDEMLVIAVIAIVVIGPKDLPRALRTLGQWVAKVRRVSGHFRSGIENMIREAELEDMERKWREQNEAIMKAHPALPPDIAPDGPPAASAEAGAAAKQPPQKPSQTTGEAADPQLPPP
jgi:sec-independent protein translocase protein TatB